MLQHCKTQWSFPEAESSSPWLHAALPSAILQHYCNFTVGDSDSADSPPKKKKNFNQPAKISTPETPQKPKKNTSSSIDGITGCSVTFWSFKGRLEVMGRFFVQSPGRWWVGWVVWFGVQHGFKKKRKNPKGGIQFFWCFLGKIFVSFWGVCLVVPTWMEAQKNLQDFFVDGSVWKGFFFECTLSLWEKSWITIT